MTDKVKVEVGTELLWKQYSHYGYELHDQRIVKVVKVHKDRSFNVMAEGWKKPKRFLTTWANRGANHYGRELIAEVRDSGNEGYGNTSGRVYPLPENATAESLKAELRKAKEAIQAKADEAQAKRDERKRHILEAQGDRLSKREPITEHLTKTTMVNGDGQELVLIFAAKSKRLWNYSAKSEADWEYEGVEVDVQSFGRRWSRDDGPSWTGSVRRDGDTLDDALGNAVVSLW